MSGTFIPSNFCAQVLCISNSLFGYSLSNFKMAKVMTVEFLALLQKFEIPQALIENIKDKECLDYAALALWGEGDSSQAMMTDAVNALVEGTPYKGARPIMAKLKQVWKACEAIVNKESKVPDGPGNDQIDMEAPMDAMVFASTQATYQTFYNFKEPNPARTGDEKVHGKVSRQFRNNAVTTWPILNTKSKAHAAKLAATVIPSKQQRVGDLVITTNAEQPVKPDRLTAHNFFRCFELLTNTWANVGCYDVQVVVHEVGKADTTKNVKMAHFSDCEEYKFKFYDQFLNLIDRHDEYKVLQYIIVIEELMRAVAWQLTRRTVEPVPFGTALLQSLRDNSHLWNEHAFLLGQKGGDHPQASVTSREAVDRARFVLYGDDAGPPKRQKVGTCNAFNKNGCSAPNCPYLHTCSHNGKGGVCGDSSHGAQFHKQSGSTSIPFKQAASMYNKSKNNRRSTKKGKGGKVGKGSYGGKGGGKGSKV